MNWNGLFHAALMGIAPAVAVDWHAWFEPVIQSGDISSLSKFDWRKALWRYGIGFVAAGALYVANEFAGPTVAALLRG